MKKFTVMILMIVLCFGCLYGCGNQGDADIVMTPTVTIAVSTPTPTAVPTPTIIPEKHWKKLNDSGTLYQVELSERINDMAETIKLFEWGENVLLVEVIEFSLILQVFEPFYGEVIDSEQIDLGSYIDGESITITETGELRVYVAGNQEFIYINRDFELVKTIRIEDNNCISVCITDDGSMVYCFDYVEDEYRVYSYNTKTKETIVLADNRIYEYESVEPVKLLFQDKVLMLKAYTENYTVSSYLFYNLESNELHDLVPAKYIDMNTYEDTYGCVFETTLPELLFGFESMRSNISCIMYENAQECENYKYFLEESMLATMYQEYIETGSETQSDAIISLRLYNLKKGTIDSKTSTAISTSACETLEAPSIYVQGKYALGLMLDNEYRNAIYIWDLTAENNESDTEISYVCAYSDLESPDMEALAVVQATADEIGNRYGVKIMTGENYEYDLGDFNATPSYEIRLIKETLKILEEVLASYPVGFFDTLSYEGTNPLTIYLVSTLTGDAEGSLAEAGALYCDGEDGQYIEVNCTFYNYLEQNLYHELSHATDYYIYNTADGYEYNMMFDALNPEGFSYDYDYIDNMDTDSSLCLYSEEAENVYFVDYYAKSFETEDRSRLAEYSLAYGIDYFIQYPHLMEKLKVMYQTISEVFGTEDYFDYDDTFNSFVAQ